MKDIPSSILLAIFIGVILAQLAYGTLNLFALGRQSVTALKAAAVTRLILFALLLASFAYPLYILMDRQKIVEYLICVSFACLTLKFLFFLLDLFAWMANAHDGIGMPWRKRRRSLLECFNYRWYETLRIGAANEPFAFLVIVLIAAYLSGGTLPASFRNTLPL